MDIKQEIRNLTREEALQLLPQAKQILKGKLEAIYRKAVEEIK
ncbi:MAG: hypothetical protein AABW80_02820 [Nanoarchaeota archaeon]